MKKEDLRFGKIYEDEDGDLFQYMGMSEGGFSFILEGEEINLPEWMLDTLKPYKPVADTGLFTSEDGDLVCRTGETSGYGFVNGGFRKHDRWSFVANPLIWSEATVEQYEKFVGLLEQEAVSRGLGEDTELKSWAGDFGPTDRRNSFTPYFSCSIGFNRHGVVFYKGDWAIPASQLSINSLEVGRVYKDNIGDVVQVRYVDTKNGIVVAYEETKDDVDISSGRWYTENCISGWSKISLPRERLMVSDNGTMMYRTGLKSGYGFIDGVYLTNECLSFDSNPESWRVATKEDEKRFSKLLEIESVSRGFTADAKLEAHADGDVCSNDSVFKPVFSPEEVWNKNGMVFKKGAWATLSELTTVLRSPLTEKEFLNMLSEFSGVKLKSLDSPGKASFGWRNLYNFVSFCR